MPKSILNYNFFPRDRCLDSLVYGGHLVGMRKLVGYRLPLVTKEKVQKIHIALVFIGVNHYVSLCHFDSLIKMNFFLQFIPSVNLNWH